MTRRLRILKNCRNKIFSELKDKLATDKDIRILQYLNTRITASESKAREKELELINSRYQENINTIINEKGKRTATGHTIEIPFAN